MKVRVELDREYVPPYAVIYADAVTDEIQQAIDILDANDAPLLARKDDRLMVIDKSEITMVRVEGGDTVIYTETEKYLSRKRLYEIHRELAGSFIRISKQTVVNGARIKSVEAGFSGTLLLRMKNGLSDYVSRKYLPALKNYLGM